MPNSGRRSKYPELRTAASKAVIARAKRDSIAAQAREDKAAAAVEAIDKQKNIFDFVFASGFLRKCLYCLGCKNINNCPLCQKQIRTLKKEKITCMIKDFREKVSASSNNRRTTYAELINTCENILRGHIFSFVEPNVTGDKQNTKYLLFARITCQRVPYNPPPDRESYDILMSRLLLSGNRVFVMESLFIRPSDAFEQLQPTGVTVQTSPFGTEKIIVGDRVYYIRSY